jgi:hypothetical protein
MGLEPTNGMVRTYTGSLPGVQNRDPGLEEGL